VAFVLLPNSLHVLVLHLVSGDPKDEHRSKPTGSGTCPAQRSDPHLAGFGRAGNLNLGLNTCRLPERD